MRMLKLTTVLGLLAGFAGLASAQEWGDLEGTFLFKGTPPTPAKITPKFLLQQTLLLEYARAHVRALIMQWLSEDGVEPRPAMELDNLEAVKRMVAAGLGASIVPLAAVSAEGAAPGIVWRPLKPALSRQLALVQRRDKPTDTALQHVRSALLSLADQR